MGAKGGKRSRKDKDVEDLVKDEDLDIIADLGAGNGGTVTKVWNKKRGCTMARKVGSPTCIPTALHRLLGRHLEGL